MSRKELSPEDYEFVNSLSAAIAEKSPAKMRGILYFWLITIALFLLWANFTQIDEITRGDGEVVPSGKNQLIQNLEGGIIKQVFAKVGDSVDKNQPLLQIDNQKSQSQSDASKIKEQELEAKIIRLKAESMSEEFNISAKNDINMTTLIKNEYSLYKSKQKQLDVKINALEEQKNQKEQDLTETQSKLELLENSLKLIKEEMAMTAPMVEQGVKSRVTFMKIEREKSQLEEEYNNAKHSIPRIKASINELDHNIEEVKIDFANQAKKEYNEAVAELMQVKEGSNALDDQIERMLVRSPIKGIIQKIYVYTLGGVIKPGENLIEIVPTDDTLWLEVKIKPSDIAFIYPSQKAIVKFTAYDFGIYGSLEGEVAHISADSTKDEKDNAFYTIHIKTNKNHLGKDEKPLKIIPGMTVSVDIITGKKSVMDYILKPILKAKQYTFTER